ncbi:MAG: hypothetical protein AAF928_02610 [Myxococcota bacterium]
MRTSLLLSLWLAAGPVGCDGGFGGISEPPEGSAGELGEGRFRYGCAAAGDPACNQTDALDPDRVAGVFGFDQEVPLSVAVGARFGLSFARDDGGFNDVVGAGDVVREQGGFTILAPSIQGFLAASTREDQIVDFTHVEAKRTSRIEVWSARRRLTEDPLPLGLGVVRVVAALPVDGLDVPLAGGAPFTWTTTDPAVVAIVPRDKEDAEEGDPFDADEESPFDDEMELHGLAEGEASVTVARDDVSAEIRIIVTGADDEEGDR